MITKQRARHRIMVLLCLRLVTVPAILFALFWLTYSTGMFGTRNAVLVLFLALQLYYLYVCISDLKRFK